MSEQDDKSEPDSRSSASCESEDSLLRAIAHVPAIALDGAALSTPGETSLLPDTGDIVDGRYELQEKLGEGGMGAVYAARNLRTDKEVAIKLLLPHRGMRPERIERFLREARAAGRIRHANVVDVYDVEATGETPYIVMERLHGESLGSRIKKGMSSEEAVRVLIDAMRGVAEAHRQGVIHRDLKPENIFLARVTGHATPVPKVLDFGVSRMLAREDGEDAPTTLTRTGHVIGTPSYMPLEQLRGSTQTDVRADVYALGVILYEALTGKRPYQAHNSHELLIQMVTEQPTPLRTRAPQIDRALEAVVMRALMRDASERYESVDAFVRALQGWLAGDRSVARLRRLPRKGFVALVIALAVLVWSAFTLRRTNEQTTDPARAPVIESHADRTDSKVSPVPSSLPAIAPAARTLQDAGLDTPPLPASAKRAGPTPKRVTPSSKNANGPDPVTDLAVDEF